MKLPLPAAIALSFLVASPVPAMAAEKKTQKPARKMPSTLPPTSKMIVVPPPDAPGADTSAPKLISSEMSGKDLLFFTTAADAGRFQAYLVELLQAKAESDQIKALGSALAATQGEENKHIARLASLKGWSVPTEPSPAQKKAGAELEKLSGSDLDKAVMDKLIAATRETVSAYEAAAQSGDPDIKNFSQQMLPLSQEKLKLAERMTGAGKAAGQLFRTGAPPKATPGAASKQPPGAASKPSPGAMPPPITPSKAKPAAPAPVAPPASAPSGAAATPSPAATPAAAPKPIPPTITN